MKIFNSYSYSYCLYSYFVSPYLFTPPVSYENKRIGFVPLPTVLPIRNCPQKYNISETDIQKFIQKIKKYEFPTEKKIPLEDF